MNRRILLLLSPLILLLVLRFSRCNEQPGSDSSRENAEASFSSSMTFLVEEDVESGLASVSTANYANPNLEYFYYFPTRLLKQRQVSHPVLVVVHGLSGRMKKLVPVIWRKAVHDNGWIALSPHFIFDERNWKTATRYHYPEAWSGQALVEIMKNFSTRYGLKLGACYLHGISAGAQFVVRFALWQPGLCRAVAAHAGGGTITPTAHVPVKFYITIGRDDVSRHRQFNWFLQRASENGISVRSKVYPGGHSLPLEQVQDSIRFFQENQ